MVIIRIHKLNEKFKTYNKVLSDLAELQTEYQNKKRTIQNELNKTSSEILLFKKMTDEDFNKTKYRKEDFKPI